MEELRLRPLGAHDEDAARRAHDALEADSFVFLLDYVPGEPWAQYLGRLDDQRHGRALPPDRVPATFLGAWVGPELVGRVSIRHELNDTLAAWGGHIGYGVVPWRRRSGHAREILRHAVIVARAVGVERILLVCDDTNVGSARTIEACGGLLESVVNGPEGSGRLRRYLIS